METEEKVKVLEDEFKLIKSELRQTLVSVRDFLLDLKIPPMQEELMSPPLKEQVKERELPEPSPQHVQARENPQAQTPRSPNGGGTGGNQTGGGYSEPSMQHKDDSPRPLANSVPGIAQEPEFYLGEEMQQHVQEPIEAVVEDDQMTSGEFLIDNESEATNPISEEVNMRKGENINSASQINLLANLIRWVSVAKKEIGIEQLPVFLGVYGIGGKLSAEMKEVILHLAVVATDKTNEICTSSQNESVSDQISLCMEINSLSGQLPIELRDCIRRLTELIIQRSSCLNKADIWSQLLLELHGIIGGGGDSLQMMINAIDYKKKNEKELKTGLEGESQDEASETTEEGFSSEPVDEEVERSPLHKGIKPARLKLVLPFENGDEKELDLGSLFIDTDSKVKPGNGLKPGNGHKKVSSPKR